MRKVTAFLIAMTALATLSGCTQPKKHAASAVVPWISAPASPTPSASPTHPAGAVACTAEMLRVGMFERNATAAAGTSYRRAPFENVTRRPCYFTLVPAARFLDANGKEIESLRQMATVQDLPIVVYPAMDLAAKKPGTYAVSLMFGTDDICNPPTVSIMEIVLPEGGGRLRVSLPSSGARVPNEPDCQKGSGHVGLLASDAPSPPEPSASPLEARIVSIGTLQGGQRLRYVVRISNPTAQAVSLDPCPSYVEGLKGVVLESHLLNCSSVRSIAANRSVDYEMFLAGPSTADLHLAVLVWSVDGGRGPSLSYFFSS